MQKLFHRRILLLTTGLILGLAVCFMLIVQSRRRVPTVSLRFVRYKQLPSDGLWYAELILSNGMQNMIGYPWSVREGPVMVPMRCRQQRLNGRGWTPERWDSSSTNATFRYEDLKPGGTVTCLIPVIPGALAKQVSVMCSLPEPRAPSGIARYLREIAYALQLRERRDDVFWCREKLVIRNQY